jgi:hypothetical protein
MLTEPLLHMYSLPGKVFIELLPNNDWGDTHTDTHLLWLHYSGFLVLGGIHRQQGDFKCLILFFQNNESGLKTVGNSKAFHFYTEGDKQLN